MGNGCIHTGKVLWSTFGVDAEGAAHGLCHGDVDALRDFAQHRADRIGNLGVLRYPQRHAKRTGHGRVVAGSRCAHGDQGHVGGELQGENGGARGGAGTGTGRWAGCGAAPLQCHLRQQRGHVAGPVLIHLAGVVQPGLNQLLTDGGQHQVHHLARGRHCIAQSPGAQAIHVAHLPRPDARGQRGCGLTPVGRHAQHMGGIAGREATVNRQTLALQPRQRA